MIERFQAEETLRAAAKGTIPSEGDTLIRDRDSWKFGPPTETVEIAPYVADDESTAYSGIDNAQPGAVYAKHADLEALRVAYENLRIAYEDLVTQLESNGVVSSS